MGCVLSVEELATISENGLLKKLVGKEPMDINDPLWNKFFSFNFQVDQRSRKAQAEVIAHVKPLLEQLLHNTRETGNFATLVRVFVRRCPEVETSAKCENKIFIWQMSNALLIVRFIVIFFAQRLSATEFVNIFEQVTSESSGPADGRTSDQLMDNLVGIITRIPVRCPITIQLHADVRRVMLALLSTQMYEECVTERSEFLRILMLQLRPQSGDLVRVLLEDFLNHSAEELDIDVGRTSSGGRRNSRSDSLVVSIWSTLQRTLTFGGEHDEAESDLFPHQNLSSLSLALLLSLVYYSSYGERANAYKQVLSIFQNAQEVSSLANLEASFKLDFTHLYNRLCASIHRERMPLLLLYLLLHNNVGFRNFVLSRINLELLILPVIRVLHDGMHSSLSAESSPSSKHSQRLPSPDTHQTYLALIVLLMLSEDDFFKKVIHEMTVKNIDWYQPERPPLAEITLGGLIVLVFSKTIQINTIKIRDRYFHMNSLATLANLASCFKQLSPLVSQKLIGLLETMTRRHSKLIKLLRESAERGGPPPPAEVDSENTGGEAIHREQTEMDDLHRDITALEEGIRTVLEIINAILCHSLRNNPDLIYTVLYKRALFEQYHQHPMFQDLVWNIYTVINHFTSKVEVLTKGGAHAPSSPDSNVNNTSVNDILDAIKKTAIEWPSDRLKKFPELRFKYIEDDNTVDFFVPYIWRLVFEGAGMFFDADAIRLFDATN